ncbi:hypothetical protein J7J13_03695, partial [bacterium]|nr:hypothetical protein [bacterium]
MMGIKKITTGDYKTFTLFALFWIFLAWLGFFSALAGFFHGWIFIVYSILGIISVAYHIRASILPFNLIRLNGKNSFSFSEFPFSKNIHRFALKEKLAGRHSEFSRAALIFFAITFLFSFFTVPTVFSGRDQGSISEAAVRLAQNHQLEFSTPASREFFKIYGPGKALNFPGFHYTRNGELTTQFPIPYIAWLGIFYSIFGLAGLIIANAVLSYLFLFSAYLLFRLFAPVKYSVIFSLLILASFSFSWFLKFTLSENMALALVWLGILQLTLFFKKPTHSVVIPEFSEQQRRKYPESTLKIKEGKEKSGLYFFSLLTILGLMAFTRIEGIATLTMLIIIMSFNKDARNFLAKNKMKRICLPVLFFIAVFILNFIVNFSFFNEIAKAVLKNPTQAGAAKSLLNTANVFLIYGIAPYLIFGTIGLIYFIVKRKRLELLPFILILPLFFYLISPRISSDHPWMLRRYAFAILPAFVFYTALWLAYYFKGKKQQLAGIIFVILLLFNIPVSLKYFAFSENKNLLEQTESLSQNFSAADLVLIDRLASGNGWSMLSGPMSFLYGKNAVYFFNPNDLDKLN